MPTYILTVKSADRDQMGLRLSPGIRPSETKDSPAVGRMNQGSRLELRRPGGSVRDALLVTHGVAVWRADGGSFYTHDDPSDPEVRLTISPELMPEDVPGGRRSGWRARGDGHHAQAEAEGVN